MSSLLAINTSALFLNASLPPQQLHPGGILASGPRFSSAADFGSSITISDHSSGGGSGRAGPGNNNNNNNNYNDIFVNTMMPQHVDENWTRPIAVGRERFPSHRRPRGYSHPEDQIVGRRVTEKVSMAFSMILIPLVAFFGSLGNVLSLRVLVHHRMRNSTNMMLAALAISDLLVLLHALYFSFLRAYTAFGSPERGARLRTLTFPLVGPYTSVVTARITTCLTTMLSLERLVAVYMPMKAKRVCGRTTTGALIVFLFLLTTLAFVPMGMKYHAVEVKLATHSTYAAPAAAATGTTTTSTDIADCCNQTRSVPRFNSPSSINFQQQPRYRLKMELTSLGRNREFFLVYGNTLNVLFRLLPIVVLIMVNMFIAKAIRRTWSFRRTMSGGATASYEQNRITLMLLMVSLVFLLCILPGAVHSIATQAYDGQYSRSGAQSNLHAIFSNMTYFLETLNSSVNFAIYMAYSTKFNRTYRQIFRCCSKERNRRRTSSGRQGSTRSILRYPLRPLNGSRSSMSSYWELRHLKQLRKHKNNADAGPAMRNGSIPLIEGRHASGMGTVQEQSGACGGAGKQKKYNGKCASNESSCCCSGNSHSRGHSHSHSSHSEHSQGSHSGLMVERYDELIAHDVDPSPEEMYS